ATIELVMRDVVDVLDKAETAPKDFTLHDSGHSFRVAELMVKIIPEEVLPKLSIYENTLLLLSAYLHDIGMTPQHARPSGHHEYLLTADKGSIADADRAEFDTWLLHRS